MISYYELLNMIKEEKAPKEIKFRGAIYKAEYDCGEFSYYYIKNVKEINEECKDYFAECFLESEMFDKNIEIIDKIEKLPYYSLERIQKAPTKDTWFDERITLLEKRTNDYHKKINQIIDKLERIEK